MRSSTGLRPCRWHRRPPSPPSPPSPRIAAIAARPSSRRHCRHGPLCPPRRRHLRRSRSHPCCCTPPSPPAPPELPPPPLPPAPPAPPVARVLKLAGIPANAPWPAGSAGRGIVQERVGAEGHASRRDVDRAAGPIPAIAAGPTGSSLGSIAAIATIAAGPPSPPCAAIAACSSRGAVSVTAGTPARAGAAGAAIAARSTVAIGAVGTKAAAFTSLAPRAAGGMIITECRVDQGDGAPRDIDSTPAAIAPIASRASLCRRREHRHRRRHRGRIHPIRPGRRPLRISH